MCALIVSPFGCAGGRGCCRWGGGREGDAEIERERGGRRKRSGEGDIGWVEVVGDGDRWVEQDVRMLGVQPRGRARSVVEIGVYTVAR